jgi:hypothetical protein
MLAMFSKTYLKQPATQKDGQRLRNRLAARAIVCFDSDSRATPLFVQLLEQESGARVQHGTLSFTMREFFHRAEMRDVLDGVSCAVRALEI